MSDPENELTVKLYESRGETSRFIDAQIVKETGAFCIEGQDIGKAPLEHWGDSDYEFSVTVAAEEKDRLLLALIERVYTGRPDAITDMRALLAEKDIAYKWFTWT